jgi:hypothetical protein
MSGNRLPVAPGTLSEANNEGLANIPADVIPANFNNSRRFI